MVELTMEQYEINISYKGTSKKYLMWEGGKS